MGRLSLLIMGKKDSRDSQKAGGFEKGQVHPLKWRDGLQWALEEEILVDLKRRKRRRKQWVKSGAIWWILIK